MTPCHKTPAACLIGWPAAHSRSPLIHHYWLRTLGIEGGYVIEAVPPEDFRDFVLRLSLRGFVGANVTIPHKEQRAGAVEAGCARQRRRRRQHAVVQGRRASARPTPMSRASSTISTPAAPGWDKATEALVLGAGGSARAVVFGLIERGIKHIHLANRTLERAQALADQFGPPCIRSAGMR